MWIQITGEGVQTQQQSLNVSEKKHVKVAMNQIINTLLNAPKGIKEFYDHNVSIMIQISTRWAMNFNDKTDHILLPVLLGLL